MAGHDQTVRPRQSRAGARGQTSCRDHRRGGEYVRYGAVIVDALLDIGVRVFFITHLYELASRFVTPQQDDVAFYNSDVTSPFKLVEAEPLQTSYGPDLYESFFNAGAAGAVQARFIGTSAALSRFHKTRHPFDLTIRER